MERHFNVAVLFGDHIADILIWTECFRETYIQLHITK
jgi:hypothetical protein